jgi:beta-mannosidase
VARIISLDGFWKLTWQPIDNCDEFIECREAIMATVPGDVHEDLVQAGLLPEPLVGTNATLHEWVERAKFTYERDLSVDTDFDRAELVFHGLDCIAEIYLDGQLIGSTSNAFVPHEFDVTKFIRKGERHILSVILETGVQWAKEVANPEKYQTGDQSPERPFLRKPQFSFKWDWAPRLVTCGIWRSVELRLYKQAAIRDVAISSEISGRAAKLSACAEVEAFEETKCTARLRVVGPGGFWQTSDQVSLAIGQNRLELALDVAPVSRWYPRGYGEQALYQVTLELENDGTLVDTRSFTYGFREIQLKQTLLADGEKTFTLDVNGIDVFCKGADWVPADSLPARVSRQKYEQLIAEACEANFNCFRIWGGGIYEDPVFYDLCDRHGILTWQDFMFACAEYPDDQEWFVENVRAEAAKVIKSLRHHPCIALWCGNNENDWLYGFMNRGKGKEIAPFYGQSIYHQLLPQLCSELDPSRPYWPSSPYGGNDPNSESEGDRHAWDVSILNPDLEARADIRNYRRDRGKFISEFGVISHALPRTIRQYTAEQRIDPSSPAYKFHDNPINAIGEGGGLSDWYQKVGFGGVPEDPLRYIYQSLLYQAMGYREAIASFRIRKGECWGSLFWMYSDCWGTLGWTIVDYYLRRKPSFYWVRKAYAPIAVFIRPEEHSAKIYVVNDTLSDRKIRLVAETGDLTRPLKQTSCEVAVQANSVIEAAELECTPGYLFAQIYEDDVLVAEDLTLTHLPKDLKIPDTQIKWSVAEVENAVEVTISSDAFGFFVWIDHPDGAVPQDNYFHLPPGRSKVIRVANTDPKEITVRALNAVNGVLD